MLSVELFYLDNKSYLDKCTYLDNYSNADISVLIEDNGLLDIAPNGTGMSCVDLASWHFIHPKRWLQSCFTSPKLSFKQSLLSLPKTDPS